MRGSRRPIGASLRAALAARAGPEAHGAEQFFATVLLALAAVICVLSIEVGPQWCPPSALVLPLAIGAIMLGLRWQWLLTLAAAVAVGIDLLALGLSAVRPGALIALALAAAVALLVVRNRQRLGFSTVRGEAMLLDLRAQLREQGRLPTLPAPWHVEVVQRSAGGASFAGDFVVSSLTERGERLEMVLVDVSGKGLDAGTRALLLSGAMGGLLGAVPPEEFLAAANSYLLRLGWAEGFATAVHLSVNLRTGDYLLTSAGHPPAAHRAGGAGQWRLSATEGPVLGLLDEPTFVAEKGTLRGFDAVLLYTDGLVEVPGRDLAYGIDRLLGEAERLVPLGLQGGAQRLVDAVGRDSEDDRALVLIWRT